MRVRITDRARVDLAEIAAYGLERHGLERTRQYQRSLREAIARLASWPRIGIAQDPDDDRLRAVIAGEHRILYDLADDQFIDVLRVIHVRSEQTARPRGTPG